MKTTNNPLTLNGRSDGGVDGLWAADVGADDAGVADPAHPRLTAAHGGRAGRAH